MSLTLVPLTDEEFPAWASGLRTRFTQLLSAAYPGHLSPEDAARVLDRSLPKAPSVEDTELLWVHDGDRSVGHLWLSYVDGDLVVRDVLLDNPEQASALRDLLKTRAAERGCAALQASWVAGEPSYEAFVNDAEFVTIATNMALALDAPQPRPDGLLLRDMSEAEYAEWRAVHDEDYIATRVRNGESPKTARSTAEAQTAKLLPDGVDTEGHKFWIAEVAGERVGLLWLDLNNPYAFVYRVEVDEQQRGRGYGRAIMQAGAYEAQRAGARGVALNVFGDNIAARRLYDSLGYHPTQGGVRMSLSTES